VKSGQAHERRLHAIVHDHAQQAEGEKTEFEEVNSSIYTGSGKASIWRLSQKAVVNANYA
jgi:hypothetical protein